MMDLQTILLTHVRQYPLMEPTDAVKLIYQNEFGGGHLIRDEKACLTYLRREYEATPQNPFSPLYEEIGNGILRINLAALDHYQIAFSDLGAVFLRSAAAIQGSLASFHEKLSVLTALTAAGSMPFSAQALDSYLQEYEKAGFPPVSHSEAYRSAYRPAYRIVAASVFSEHFKQMP